MTRRDKRARAKALARSFCLSATALGLLSAFSLVSVPFARAADDDLAATCARVGDDDALRDYQPSLKAGAAKIFKTMFPGANSPPDEAMLRAQAKFRCMDGKVYACFIGANLPCGKLNTSRHNAGAEAYCRTDPEADFIPMAATGHDFDLFLSLPGRKARGGAHLVRARPARLRQEFLAAAAAGALKAILRHMILSQARLFLRIMSWRARPCVLPPSDLRRYAPPHETRGVRARPHIPTRPGSRDRAVLLDTLRSLRRSAGPY